MEEKDVKAVRKGFLNRTSVYGLEFAVAMITMITTASVLSFAAYILGGYLASTADLSEGAGYFALWTVASTVVWAPVALIFYLRSRAEILAKPSLHDNPVQRTFVVIYQVIMILIVISFAISAIYTLLMSFVKPDETGTILLSGTLPSAVSVLLFWLAHMAFFRKGFSRRTFAILFSAVVAALVIPVVVLSIISLRSVANDRIVETDLSAIKDSIDNYADVNKQAPRSLNDLKALAPSKVKDRLSDYKYTRVDERRYQLCGDFVADSRRESYVSSRNDRYTMYPYFDQHTKGEVCFKVQTTAYSSSYDIYDTND